MITINASGSFKNMEQFLKKMTKGDQYSRLESLARTGVDALAAYTPKESGLTASSWSYSIDSSRGSLNIAWYNTNVNRGVNIAVILHYGHGTGTGGYVVGRDYINPAIQPVFDRITQDVWRVVTNA